MHLVYKYHKHVVQLRKPMCIDYIASPQEEMGIK